MRPPISLGAYSDIHYEEYSSGVTVADCVRVDRAFTDRCLEREVSFCIFGGDRYLSHTPQDWIRLEADRVQRERSERGLVAFSLVGNHDIWAKAPVSGHSNRQVQQLWADVHPNLVVMDEARTYAHSRLPHVRIHALPAGFQLDISRYEIRPDVWNIMVFHAMVEGCIIDHQTGYRSPRGVLLKAFDQPFFDLVLAGDVHTPQRFDLVHTRGGYIGAAIQQNRRDRGDLRGYLFCQLGDDQNGFCPSAFSAELDPSPCPHFVEIDWDFDKVDRLPTVDEARDYLCTHWGETGEGALVDIVLRGRREQVELATHAWRDELRVGLGARAVKPPIKVLRGVALGAFDGGLTALLEGESGGLVDGRSLTALEQLRRYLGSGRVSLDGLDAAALLERARPVLEVAKGSER